MNYPGGKGAFFQRLVNLIPPHEVYIESHLGGGAVMRKKKPANRNIGIEIDPKVINMWNNSNQTDFDLIHGDSINYLKEYQFTGKEFVYCDPPYLRETRKKHNPIYKYEFTNALHIELLEVIKSLPCMVMISGYESELYTKLLKGWHTYSFQASCHYGVAVEYLWMNYPPPDELHDYSYLGDNYKDRERIMLRSKRWIRRLNLMPAIERNALLAAIHDYSKTKPEKNLSQDCL